MSQTIAIASDHAGVALKTALISCLESLKYEVIDLGPQTEDSVDYPDYALRAVEAVTKGQASKGILICGTGIGMSIAANRHANIRAALCHDVTTAGFARAHNDANILVLGARVVSKETAHACVEAFLTTEFEGGRHARRVEKLS